MLDGLGLLFFLAEHFHKEISQSIIITGVSIWTSKELLATPVSSFLELVGAITRLLVFLKSGNYVIPSAVGKNKDVTAVCEGIMCNMA